MLYTSDYVVILLCYQQICFNWTTERERLIVSSESVLFAMLKPVILDPLV